jgi:hypothetical protein
MNQPQFPPFQSSMPPQQPFAGQQPPMQQPQQPPMQQPPMQQPQQPQFQSPMPPQPGMYQPQQIAAAAQSNIFLAALNDPNVRGGPRARCDAGTYIVQFTQETVYRQSQQDGQPIALFQFLIIDGTVPQNRGQSFGYPLMLRNKFAAVELADIAKLLFGVPQVQQWAQQNVTPYWLAEAVCRRMPGMYAKLVVRPRTTKSKPNDPPFLAHYFSDFAQQPIPLAQAMASGGSGAAPTMQMPQPQFQQPQFQQPQFQQPQFQQPQQPQFQQPQQPQFQQPVPPIQAPAFAPTQPPPPGFGPSLPPPMR